MNEDENIKHVADIALGAGGIASIAWLPLLHNINEVAATVAGIGGAVLVLIRLYYTVLALPAYRNVGKPPPSDPK